MNLLLKIPESISEMVLFSPILRVIKEKLKNSHITILANEKALAMFADDPYVDEVWVIEDKFFIWKYFWNLYSKFKGRKFTHYVYFSGSTLPNFVAWLKRIKVRAGIKEGFGSIFLNHGQNQRRDFIEMHETEYNLNLLQSLGIRYLASERSLLETKLTVDKNSATKTLARFGQEVIKDGVEYNNELIFLQPGAPGLHPVWSSRNLGSLIEKLEKNYPDRFTYIISYTLKDKPFLEGLKLQLGKKKNDNLRGKVYFFDGALQGLRYYMEVLSHAKLFVGHAVGPYYLANALGVKTIGLYLPLKSVSAFRWAPFHLDTSRSKVVVPEVVCAEDNKCTLNKCPYYECMGRIEVDSIFQMAAEFLE